MIIYRDIENYEKTELLNFFRQVDSLFPIPLSHKQDLEVLSEKLLAQGIVIGAYCKNDLVGVICGYANDAQSSRAYISVLCVSTEFQGKSIARTLVEKFVDECRKTGMVSAFLYTHQTNIAAQRLYKKMGFKEETDKSRPQDFLYTLLL